MFAVPGWALPSAAVSISNQEDGRPRKRKRTKAAEITDDNVDALWKQVIEGKPPKADAASKPKNHKSVEARGNETAKPTKAMIGMSTNENPKKSAKIKKPKPERSAERQSKAKDRREEQDSERLNHKRNLACLTDESLVKSHVQMTPLQQKMSQKLTAARFRHLNEQLYTSSSAQAQRLFIENPRAYASYHDGFRAQVASWPSNPVDEFIQDIKSRATLQSQHKMVKKKQPKDALPRANRACRIVDLGCGDAKVAASLLPSAPKDKLNLHIRSFDLASNENPLITVADITDLRKIGVSDSSVDIAICCLSLMSTNWIEVVDECRRCVREGGEVWVAEIKSRFRRPEQLQKGKRQAKKRTEDDDILKDLDETPQQDDQTNLGPFLGVWQRRGFSPKGPPDVSNKMFVKIRFIKRSLEQTNGKRFIEEDLAESRILKPCLYKTR